MALEPVALQSANEAAPAASTGSARRSPHPLIRVAASAIGGVLLFLAFPPIDLWFCAPIGVALCTLALYGTAPRRAAWLGYVGGATFLIPALAWLRPIGDDAWLGLVAIESLFWAAMGTMTTLATRLRLWPLWAACLWVVQEWARGLFPVGGFPWARVAFSQGESPYTSYASLGGAPLVTFAVVLSGTLLAFTVLRLAPTVRRTPIVSTRIAWPRIVAWSLVGAVVVPVLGAVVPRPGDEGRTVRIGVVQGNVPGRGMGFLGDEPAIVLQNHANETHKLAQDVRAGKQPKPDIVIWPENSTDIDPYRSAFARDVITSAVRDIGVPVLVGAVALADDGVHRQTRGVVWDPVTGPGAYYNKQKLVPFGEFVPGKELLEKFISRVSLVGRQSLAGETPGALRMGPVTVGAVECYEVAFDGVVRDTVTAGGTPLVVQTNNATYALTNLPPQQLAMSKLRAVEHNRAVVTAATTGISAYVDPDGKVTWQTGELVPDRIVVTVPVRTRDTIATKVGALPEWILILMGLGATVTAIPAQWRKS